MPPINRVKAALRSGRKAHGFRLTIPSPAVVEILGFLNYDYVYIDDEHGVFGNEVLEDICRAADLVGMTPIARVPDLTSPTVNRRLDRGIRGIIGPHVSTREDAEMLVQSCLFGPQGSRSLGGGRGVGYQIGISNMKAYYAAANENMFVGAMIEDRTGMDNLEAIVTVEGIDCILIGQNDFAQGLGFPGESDHPEVKAAVAEIGRRVRACGGRMRDDCLVLGNLPDMLLDGGRRYAAQQT
jgi:2-keto-3-deoxy-L-rhamnonate aldolase RhmA